MRLASFYVGTGEHYNWTERIQREEEALAALTKISGGASAFPGRGAWRRDSGDVVTEANLRFDIVVEHVGEVTRALKVLFRTYEAEESILVYDPASPTDEAPFFAQRGAYEPLNAV